MVFFKYPFYLGSHIKGIATCEQEDYRVKLTKHIDHEFEETSFISRTTDGSNGSFYRAKVMTMKGLMLFIMGSKNALQRGLDDFYGEINTGDYSIRKVTK